jgi:hypothetical protein
VSARSQLLESPQDAPARYAIGRILLERGDEDGLRWLDAAMERDQEVVLPACELAARFLNDRGREPDANTYVEHARALSSREANPRRFIRRTRCAPLGRTRHDRSHSLSDIAT